MGDSSDKELEELKIENKRLQSLVIGYEKILKLNEKELENAEEMIQMYENIIEYARLEMKDLNDTAKVRDEISNLSRKELMDALAVIDNLESQNQKLKEERNNNCE
jgi:cysteinyl-tRNA synthetase